MADPRRRHWISGSKRPKRAVVWYDRAYLSRIECDEEKIRKDYHERIAKSLAESHGLILYVGERPSRANLSVRVVPSKIESQRGTKRNLESSPSARCRH